MKRNLSKLCCYLALLFTLSNKSLAQINLLQDYKNNYSAPIGNFQQINFREGGFSGLFPIAHTNGKEFWTCSDRGVNVDAANANPAACRPTYDKIYGFANYAPKIHRIRINGDSLQILETITMKRPGGTTASGLLNPTGFGSTAAELVSTDTILDCANFLIKTAPKDVWGIDAEGLVVDKDGNFWICEEGGATIWKLNRNGVVINRFTPYANLPGAEPQDILIDTVFKYRKNNRGFEGIAITPNGKIYAMIQSPVLYPSKSVGEGTRIHRILEIDPATNATRMFAYLNDGIIGASGSNQIRLRDWKIGDMAAINDSTFLVLEAALRGTSDFKKVYTININNATPVTSGLYNGVTLEALVDSSGLAANNITPVIKTLFLDLLANGWSASLEKPEGIAVIDDSTVAICNDNDYGQISPAENGVATATGITSHLYKYGLQGVNKLADVKLMTTTLSQGRSGQNSSQSPYLHPTVPNAHFTSILTVGDAANNYKMVGIPDGLGAYDNNNGTFTLLMNHELGNSVGVVRAHGNIGAFVSKWIINKSDLSVVSGADLIQKVNIWDATTSAYTTYTAANPAPVSVFSRFCSGDLPEVSAFYNPATGLGTQERLYLNGEEAGAEGRAFAHISTGANAGTTYELPYLGKYSWENALANPASGDKTIVAGTDDATPGQVYFYVGDKTNNGSEIEKAGLSNGKLWGVSVSGFLIETSAVFPAPGTPFTLADLGYVQNTTGANLQISSVAAGVTEFLRPEDGAWDPAHPQDFYFNTTNGFGNPSRVWKLHFDDLSDPAKGGTITAVLDGTEGQQMLDNMAIDNSGHIMLQEDVGNNLHIGKIWQYTIATDELKQVAQHDSTRFFTGGSNFLTLDEEASGMIDVQSILGPGMFLTVDQAHYRIPGELVEGGQLMAFYNPDTDNANPEISITGNGILITDDDTTPDTIDNTDFGNVNPGSTLTKTFVITNNSKGTLVATGFYVSGTGAAKFTIAGANTFPFTLAPNSSKTITVQFAPTAAISYVAALNILSNDFDEATYSFALIGNGVCTPYPAKIVVTPAFTVAGQMPNTIFLGYGPQSVQLFASVSDRFGIGTYKWSVGESGDRVITVSPKVTTTYTVTITNLYGCTTTASQTITVIDVRGSNITKIRVCHNGNTLEVAANAVQAHLAHGDKLGNCNGVKEGGEIEITSNLRGSVYPNPSSDKAIISVKLAKDDRISITIIDLQGKKVLSTIEKSVKAGEQRFELNSAGLKNGIYLVQIASGIETISIKMVVVH